MNKRVKAKLVLHKETIRNVSGLDLAVAVGGVSARCGPTGMSECSPCVTETCSDGSCGTVKCC